MTDRCPECGSWDRNCGARGPVPGCRCVRCAISEIARLREALAGVWEAHNVDGTCRCAACEIVREKE